MTESPGSVQDAPPAASHLHRIHRMKLSAEDRRSAMEALLLRPGPHTRNRFALMMVLSVVIATMGLLQSSSAVVIGAMMVAPLMAPILGMAASIVMGWGGRLFTSSMYVALSTAGAVALAWALARFIPVAVTGVPIEVLARSSPDIRDLVVALAAGTAGAYATVRRDVSGALPGVAVAVALVPPLAAVGVLLGREQPDLARGAVLLFAANLFGILFAAAVVFLVTGFVPERVRQRSRTKIFGALVLIVIPVAVIGTLLTQRFLHTATDARTLRAATEVAQEWLTGSTSDELGTIRLVGDTLEVNVSGPEPAPPTEDLSVALEGALGRPTAVSVRWTRVRNGDAPDVPQVILPLDEVNDVVEMWLEAQSLRLNGLSYSGATLVVDAVGPRPPGDAASLQATLTDALGQSPTVSMAWTREEQAAPEEAADDATVAEQVTRQWAEEQVGVTVLTSGSEAGRVSITLASASPPDVTDLEGLLTAALPDSTVEIRWVPSTQLHAEPPAFTTFG